MQPLSWPEFCETLLLQYAPPLRSPATLRMMFQALNELGAHIATVAELDEAAIARFVAAQPPARSVARTVALLRCHRIAANFAARKGWIPSSPFAWRGVNAWLRADSKPRRKKLVLSADDVGRFLEVMDRRASTGGWREGRARALAYIYAFTGLRRDEGTHLLRRNFDRRARTLTVEPFAGWRPKTVPSARTVPLHRQLYEVLCEWEPRCGSDFLTPGHRLRGPWKGGPGYQPIDVFRDAAREAGIGDITIIAIRRTLATMSPAWGIDPEFRRQLLGHTDVETSETWYIQREVELLRTAVNRIHYGPPSDPPASRRPSAAGSGR